MGFDWSTFALEAVNFLILVWILSHFFYRPVAGVIERRRLAIETSLRQAGQTLAQAEAMQHQYEARLDEWEAEKRRLRESWVGELAAEKARQMESFRQSLEVERERTAVLEQRRLDARERELEKTALELGGRFAARLLQRLAGPELEARLVDLFLEDLAAVPEERWPAAAAGSAEGVAEAALTTAYPLPERHRSWLQQAVESRLGRPVECRFLEDPALIAGIRLELGPLALGANLADELAFFHDAD